MDRIIYFIAFMSAFVAGGTLYSTISQELPTKNYKEINNIRPEVKKLLTQ